MDPLLKLYLILAVLHALGMACGLHDWDRDQGAPPYRWHEYVTLTLYCWCWTLVLLPLLFVWQVAEKWRRDP